MKRVVKNKVKFKLKCETMLKWKSMVKIISLLGTGEKKWSCGLLPFKFSSRNKTNKQTNKQNNLLTLTVSCEKSSCSIRSKKKKTKP